MTSITRQETQRPGVLCRKSGKERGHGGKSGGNIGLRNHGNRFPQYRRKGHVLGRTDWISVFTGLPGFRKHHQCSSGLRTGRAGGSSGWSGPCGGRTSQGNGSGVFREVPYGSGHVDFAGITKTAMDMGVRRFLAEFWYDGRTDWKQMLRDNNRFLRHYLDQAEEAVHAKPTSGAEKFSL